MKTKKDGRGAAQHNKGKAHNPLPVPGHVEEVLLRPAPSPHIDLALTLLKKIGAGKYPVGGRLPTETQLCEQFSLSRYAVREAVQKLCDLGVVTRRAGIGTKVISSQVQFQYTQVMDSLNDLTRYTESTTFQVMSRKELTINRQRAEDLGLPVGSKWMQIHGLRFGGEDVRHAIALVDIYVASVFAIAFNHTPNAPVHKLIELQYGVRITRVEQEIQGALIGGDAASDLGVAEASPGLRIIRSYFVDKQLVERTIGLHPASRFSYLMTFNLNTAQASAF